MWVFSIHCSNNRRVALLIVMRTILVDALGEAESAYVAGVHISNARTGRCEREKEKERRRVVQTRGPQRLGFGPRRVFLPPVWPPPRLIVFCLVHRMLCTAYLTSPHLAFSSSRSTYHLLHLLSLSLSSLFLDLSFACSHSQSGPVEQTVLCFKHNIEY